MEMTFFVKYVKGPSGEHWASYVFCSCSSLTFIGFLILRLSKKICIIGENLTN